MHDCQRFCPWIVLCSIGLFAQFALPTYASNFSPTDDIKNGGVNSSLGDLAVNGGGSSNTVDCNANPEHPMCGDPPTNGGAGGDR